MKEYKTSSHFMVDIETLSTENNAAIVQIAAVRFNPSTGEIVDSIDIRFDVKELVDNSPFDVSYGTTFEFWMQKMSAEVRQDVLFEGKRYSLRDGLILFTEFIKEVDKPIMWGKGPSFDLAKIEYALKVAGVQKPWQYWNERCVRTMYAFEPTLHKEVEFPGEKHNALNDAKHQAIVVSKIVQRLLTTYEQ